jgi:A/G-specific adenine glycosylase
MSAQSTPTSAARFRRALLAWYRRAARDLPWRRTRDPYAVLVSEFMLQQTQVSRVVDYYGPFLVRYPTVRHLARARASQVREAWEGLGYYRRAANLHRLAREVVAEHDGVIPPDPAALRRLPGVGAYTAGAVATFAYERPAAAVDTNVGRVLARVFRGAEVKKGGGDPRARGAKGRRSPTPVSLRDVTGLAEALQPRRGRTAWAFNQALMELGALVCTARTPKCAGCPVRSVCKWLERSGGAPAAAKRRVR